MPDKKVFYNVVNGERVEAADGSTLDVVNPATGQVYATSPLSGKSDVDNAFAAARTAFETWRDVTPARRQLALLRIADVLETHAEELVCAEAVNTGKPLAVTRAEELPACVDHLRFFAGAARALDGRAAGEYLDGFTSYVRREPVGVCAQVAPWNYPLMMAVWKIAPAIAAGNTVVLKPSDTTPATTVMLAELVADLLPPGVLNVVCGDRTTGRALVAHRAADMVSITGSVRAGAEVAAAAAADLKRVHLELGGNAPVVVFDDADVDAAATAIAAAGFFNAGQDCTAATRVLVSDDVHDEFVVALADAARQTRTGAPDQDVHYGALNSAAQLERVSGFVARLPRHATVEAGGHRIGDRGYFYAPTVVSGVRPGDEIVREEVFGPVITVQMFTDEADAIREANGTDYALASSVWTRDHGRAARMSRRLDFGCVWINSHLPLAAEMPHGGFKHSGYGKDLSMYSLEDYTRVKHVMSSLD
ncbi:gamma-aminobutyraldehyde dehydrogenase [Lentzea sp. NEAU-D7]|uniref:gamma-aminobutyraldehyde dehydrogenase n=1 Tax=Lentzea sp. NEAU-D7 TaxID=2994667 RepID=UPI00224B72A9|nr:gamma-aminobutyraldehyde dehydrogenase [Lentzea sp. NEAU-D7]MCX2954544.1 gamma-aminobutyraldehyde dehydrogenase [Lentzea sp. NEAU-D7]